MKPLDDIPTELLPLYEQLQRALMGLQPLDPKKLREASPLAWDTTPFPADVEL